MSDHRQEPKVLESTAAAPITCKVCWEQVPPGSKLVEFIYLDRPVRICQWCTAKLNKLANKRSVDSERRRVRKQDR